MENIFHVYNKSIAGFVIFNDNDECSRMVDVLRYYRDEGLKVKFSRCADPDVHRVGGHSLGKIVEILTYCLMPTHFHLLLRQNKQGGIARYINTVLNSYTRYFNLKHKRKGPLWEGRSKKVLVTTEQQFLHLTRYIHLNPVTAYLVTHPEDWAASSYREYISVDEGCTGLCTSKEMVGMDPISYRKFVEDGISYGRRLAGVKALLPNRKSTA